MNVLAFWDQDTLTFKMTLKWDQSSRWISQALNLTDKSLLFKVCVTTVIQELASREPGFSWQHVSQLTRVQQSDDRGGVQARRQNWHVYSYRVGFKPNTEQLTDVMSGWLRQLLLLQLFWSKTRPTRAAGSGNTRFVACVSDSEPESIQILKKTNVWRLIDWLIHVFWERSL